MRRLRDLVEVVTAFLAAAVACLSVMMPVDFSRVAGSSALHQYLLVVNVPRADTAGAIAAVIAVVLAVQLGDTRLIWIAAGCTGAALLVNAVFSRRVASDMSLTTLNYIDSIFGGVLLGLVGAVVVRRRIAGAAFMFGAIASTVVGDLTELPSVRDALDGRSLNSPPLWSIVLVVVLIVVSACWHRRRRLSVLPERDAPFGSVVAAAIGAGATLFGSEWFAGHGVGVVPAVLASVATVLVAVLSAFILTGRDGSIVLLGVAFAAAGSAIVAVPRPGWTPPLLFAMVGVGLWIGARWRYPMVAIGLVAGLAVFAAVAPDPDGRQVIPTIGAFAVAFIAGYCFGSAVPRLIPNRVLGISVLFVPSVVLAIRGAQDGRVAYSQLWYRDSSSLHDSTAGWTALAITLGCALGLVWLRSVRPASAPRRDVESARAQRESLLEGQ